MLTRRRLLSILGIAPLAGAAPGLSAGKRPAARTLINRFSIAGFQYYDGPDAIHALKAGDRLTLAAEPDNPHDEFAVTIHAQGLKLGHVPRSDNRHISRLLQAGAGLQAEIEAVYPGNPPWQAVKAAVYMTVRRTT